jgi:hypothetical protein
MFNGGMIPRGSAEYRPLAGMLKELHQRYQRPVLLSETGCEDEERVPWFKYVVDQVLLAIDRGVPMEGVCWYPFLDYPGWDDGRYCPTGLFGYPDGEGKRAAFHPLHLQAQALQQRLMAQAQRDIRPEPAGVADEK